jgi:hypothetical protein
VSTSARRAPIGLRTGGRATQPRREVSLFRRPRVESGLSPRFPAWTPPQDRPPDREAWDGDIVPQLVEYIRIPNKSPMFDAELAGARTHGRGHRAARHWARKQAIKGMKVEVVRLEGRTPLIFVEIDGQGDDCVLLYGHTRQATGDDRLGRDLGRGSRCSRATAVRPRRRRRRLRDLRLDDRIRALQEQDLPQRVA